MTFEFIQSEWFNPNALRLPNYRVGRVNYGEGRSYIKINEDGSLAQPFRLFTSLTTAINTCAPMEAPLLSWYCNNGLEEAKRKLKLSQHFGTLLHLEIGKYLQEGSYELSTLPEIVEAYTSQHNYWQPECEGWAEKLKYDLLAFAQFCEDYKVEPMGIEYVLLSNRGFGTLIDLVCKMTITEPGLDYDNPYKSGPRKGEPRECKVERTINAVINFKSGRHAFYRSNGIQALAEKQLFEENFPDIKIDAAYNWAPKDWTSVPGYYLKDWADEIEPAEVEAMLQLAEIRFAQKAINRKYTNIYGTIHKNEPVSGLIHQESVEEFCNKKYGNAPAVAAPATPAPSPATKTPYTPTPLNF